MSSSYLFWLPLSLSSAAIKPGYKNEDIATEWVSYTPLCVYIVPLPAMTTTKLEGPGEGPPGQAGRQPASHPQGTGWCKGKKEGLNDEGDLIYSKEEKGAIRIITRRSPLIDLQPGSNRAFIVVRMLSRAWHAHKQRPRGQQYIQWDFRRYNLLIYWYSTSGISLDCFCLLLQVDRLRLKGNLHRL